MGLFTRLWGPRKAARAISYETGLINGLCEPPTRSGVVVTDYSALGVSAVWCACNVISQSIGSLPFTLYEDQGDGTYRPADNHPLTPVLDEEPNPETTARVFWETFVFHCLLHGNGYAEIVRSGSGRAVELWNIHPRNVTPERDRDGKLVYRITVGGITTMLPPEDVLHVPGLGDGSGVGFDLLKLARDNISFSISADRYGQAYFGNAGNAGLYITTPQGMSEKAVENIRRSFQRKHVGIDATGSVAILQDGVTARREALSNDGAQYDETRRFQITEVSRLFNISPVKLHELGRATWGNLATLNTDFWGTTCRPWAEKIEAEVERKLLTRDERRTYTAEFDADTLLRGDVTTRYAAYAVGIQAGFLTPETVAEWEHLPMPPEPAPAPVPATQDTNSNENTNQEDDGDTLAAD